MLIKPTPQVQNLRAEVFKAVVADVMKDNVGKTPDEIAEKMHRRFSGLDAKRMTISGLTGVEDAIPEVTIVPK